MKIPTTRRGRFLYYKFKYQRRMIKLERRRRYNRPARDGTRNRERDVSGLQYQPERPSALPGNGPLWPLGFTVGVYRKGKGRGFPPVFTFLPGSYWGDKHRLQHHRHIGFIQRRVLKIPRLKHLPVLPYVGPKPEGKRWRNLPPVA
jgi:hypothetical protein